MVLLGMEQHKDSALPLHLILNVRRLAIVRYAIVYQINMKDVTLTMLLRFVMLILH